MLTSWNYPDDEQYSDYPAFTDVSKKKILGLNAAKLYDLDVPADLRLAPEAGTPAAPQDAQLVQG
jgi:hypothetical protein